MRYIAMSALVAMVTAMCYPNTSTSVAPLDVVVKFCELDARGMRLSSTTSSAVTPLVAWEAAPGWDSVIVVAGCEASLVSEADAKAVVDVEYEVLGFIGGYTWYPMNTDDETVSPILVNSDRVQMELVRSRSTPWQIASPLIRPHVHPEIMLKRLRRHIGKELIPQQELMRTIEHLEMLTESVEGSESVQR